MKNCVCQSREHCPSGVDNDKAGDKRSGERKRMRAKFGTIQHVSIYLVVA